MRVARLLFYNSSDDVIAPLAFEYLAHGVFPGREEFGDRLLRKDYAARLPERFVEIAAL